MENESILVDLRKYIHKLEIKYAELREKAAFVQNEKKKLLKKLSKQLAEKNMILTASMEGFAIISDDGKIQFINDSVSDIFELDGAQIINRFFYELELDSDKDNFLNKISEAKEKKNILFSTYIKTKSKVKSLDVSLNFFIIQNQPLLFLLMNDTTEKKITEIQLKASEKSYKTLMESLPDIVYKLDEHGQFTYVNSSIKSLGYEPDELIGRHFSVIIHPDDVKKISRYYVLPKCKGSVTGLNNAPKLFDERRTGDRKTINLQVRVISKADYENHNKSENKEQIGTVISWGEVTAAGQYLLNHKNSKNDFIGTIGIIRDITGRKLEETSLKSREEFYRSIVETQTELISRFQPSGAILYANPAFCKYYCIDSDKIINYNIFDFALTEEISGIKNKLGNLSFQNPTVEYTYQSVITRREKICVHHRTDTAVYDDNKNFVCYQSVERRKE